MAGKGGFRTVCAVALLGAAGAQAADAPPDQWMGMADANGCRAEVRQRLIKQSITWSGGCRDGLAEGKGTFQMLVDGLPLLSYEGEMKAGRFSGAGVRTAMHGRRHEGSFAEGRLLGPGRLTYPGGATAQGDFVADRLDGACTLAWPSGDRFEGQCKAARPDGQGRTELANGDIYVGGFSEGLPSGQGRYFWANGDRYEGRLAMGQAAGPGEYRLADGSVYTGNFRFGVPWGQGRVQLPDGSAYEGSFELGAPGASGRFTRADGSAAPESEWAELRAKLRLRYAKARLPAPAWQEAAPSSYCSKLTPPEVPKKPWAGQSQYRAVVIVHAGQVTTVDIQPVLKADDAALHEQLMANIDRAVRSYQCSGDRVFEQRFSFRWE